MTTKRLMPPKSLGRQLNFSAGKVNALAHKILEPHGLTLPQWVVLSALWREQDLTVRELANYIGNQLPATSRIIERMWEKGLIVRRADKVDRRVVHVGLSVVGQSLSHLSDLYLRVNDAAMDGFTQQEKDTLFELLSRVEQNAVKASHEGD